MLMAAVKWQRQFARGTELAASSIAAVEVTTSISEGTLPETAKCLVCAVWRTVSHSY